MSSLLKRLPLRAPALTRAIAGLFCLSGLCAGPALAQQAVLHGIALFPQLDDFVGKSRRRVGRRLRRAFVVHAPGVFRGVG